MHGSHGSGGKKFDLGVSEMHAVKRLWEGDAMEAGQGTSCSACGQQYSWSPALAGKKVRCGCGQVFVMPEHDRRLSCDEALMELAPEPIAPAKPKVDRAALNEAIRTRMGAILGKTGETKERERLEAARAEEDKHTRYSAIRDTWLPIILIALGIWLNFYEVTHVGSKPLSMSQAVPIVIGKLVLAVALVSGGIVLARALLDVTLVHGLGPSMLRLLAIAIGPCAVYGLFANGSSELAGPVIGTLLSLAIYSVLYWGLLQLDARDTAICVLTTWILVAAANYAAFRAQGIMMGTQI